MSHAVPDRDQVFDCTGEMAERYAAFDWSSTTLGPVGSWPESLRGATSLLLRTRFPMILSWGDDYVMLYNDAFIPHLGSKHPRTVGGLLSDAFSEIWDQIGPSLDSVLHSGAPTWDEDRPFVLENDDTPQEAYFTYSYSHVPDPAGPGGVLSVLAGTTAAVVGARRLSLLNELANRAAGATDRDQAIHSIVAVLGGATQDLSYGCCIVEDDLDAIYSLGTFGDPPTGWCETPSARHAIAEAGSSLRGVVRPVPATLDGPTHLVALPIRGRETVVATLVVAPHPLRPLDADHRRFLDLVADQVGQVIGLADARAAEAEHLERLAALDTAKSTFLSNISHEFRTPLTLLLGPLEAALSGRSPGLDHDDLSSMQHSALRLLRMVEALLDIHTMQSGERVAQWEAVDVQALTQELLHPFALAAARAGLGFEVDLAGGQEVMDCDPGLWETVVLNLVANAVKYTLTGSVRVVLERLGDEEVLTVADTGVGIPDAELSHIFERFHRVHHQDARTIEGTGIGLALVQDAVNALGGNVSVTSALGEGSTFVARFPIRSASAGEVVASTERGSAMATAWADDLAPYPDESPSDETALHPEPLEELPTILVVDDNSTMRRQLAKILQQLGTVRTAQDGLEALELVRQGPIDLVVADAMMPHLDGVGLVIALRSDPLLAAMPIVIVSARANAGAAVDALNARADDYIVKPFTEGELVARCRATLELARLRAEATAVTQSRATMLAGVSHDMQTPLAVIVSALSLLTEEQGLSPELRAIASRAVLRGEQLGRLVHTFLDWSRITNGVELAPRTRAEEILGLVERVAASYPGVQVISSDQPLDAEIDADRTSNILHNLLTNAERVSVEAITITIAASEEDVTIEVRDDGAGVARALLPRLFESFASSSERGTGLGLHISRLAARAQGGDLTLESTGPHGSVFVLTLPRA